jgi:3-oxoacyl-[acyl-carrier-protein] synthase-3
MRIDLNGLKIIGTGSSNPSHKITNEELALFSPVDPSWTKNILGITSRYYLSKGENLSQLVLEATLMAVSDAQLQEQPNLLLVATSTPDYINPSMACILHERLELTDNCAAFDIQAVCNGFLYGLATAASLLTSSGMRNAIIVGADQFSRITDYKSRNASYFGDGAGAVILNHSELNDTQFVIDLYAQGSGWNQFSTSVDIGTWQMDGRGAFNTVMSKVPRAILNLLKDYQLNLMDVDLFVFHQPSAVILDGIENELKIPRNKIVRILNDFGNTAGATVPMVLHKVFHEVRNTDKLVCFASFGSGWTWSVGLYRDKKTNL